MSKDALSSSIRELLKNDPVPSFEEVWEESARLIAKRTTSPVVRYRQIIPVAAGAVFVIGIAAFFLHETFRTSDSTPPAQHQFALADLGAEKNETLTNSPLGQADTNQDLYELPTDFLLTLDMLAWDEVEERSPQ